MSVQLNEQQQGLVALLNKHHPCTVIKGHSGTGKSTALVAWMNSQASKVLLTAPTNKAVSVLRKMCKEQGAKADCSTIHSALGLTMKWVKGEQVLVKNKKLDGKEPFRKYGTVAVDEAGMLGNKEMGYVGRAQQRAQNRVIFMGDPCQLPPTEEHLSLSPSFDAGPSVELTTNVRQNGGMIPELGQFLRQRILSGGTLALQDFQQFVDDKTIHCGTKADLWGDMLDDFEEGSQDIRHLSFRNDAVKFAIKAIRARLYGSHAPELMQGEHVQALKPIKDPVDYSVSYSTDALLTIEEIREAVFHGLPVWKIRIEGVWYVCVKGEFETIYKEKENELYRRCASKLDKWDTFQHFVDSFSWVRPAHAMTIHKAQGSTFDKVYVNCRDIISIGWDNDLMLKLFYVACTRPSKELVLIL